MVEKQPMNHISQQRVLPGSTFLRCIDTWMLMCGVRTSHLCWANVSGNTNNVKQTPKKTLLANLPLQKYQGHPELQDCHLILVGKKNIGKVVMAAYYRYPRIQKSKGLCLQGEVCVWQVNKMPHVTSVTVSL